MPELVLLILGLLAALVGVMAVAWIVQRAARDTGWVDVFWTLGSGAACVAAALWPLPSDQALPERRWLVAALAGVWSLRLGLYIAVRVGRAAEEDSRYRALRETWGAAYQRRLLPFVLVQAPVGAVLALAAALAARAPGSELGLRDMAALAIGILAIAGESLADAQMSRFRKDPANHGRIMDEGLWGLSRHPNYFFEWITWWAYPVLALDPSRPVTWLSLGAPLVMFLILRFVTGVPPLERSMLARRGRAFAEYQSRVNAFVPGPPRRPAPESKTA
jgi:steroid 5-alpha reductase family enzyme